ncbi:MAG: hypothetical protein M1817_006742 [Caeruleum heppii]|nr:MAG: hypothetical protein M1817_006742 [Caeruleum heppii]
MPRSLAKVHKQISKKRGKSSALNENSRDSQRLRRAGMREDKIIRELAARTNSNKALLQRVEFFKQAVAESHLDSWTRSTVQSLIERYIHRDDEDLAVLKKERRSGRPASRMEEQLKAKLMGEQVEYEKGFYMPDIEEAINRDRLVAWSGEWASLSQVSFVRVFSNGTRLEARFPPKGDA